MKSRVLAVGRIALGIVASVGLGWLVVRSLDWGEVADALSNMSLPMVALAMCIFLGATYLRAVRWRVMFVNDEVSSNRLFVVQNIGIGLNNVTPIRIASEAAQLAILSLRDRVPPAVVLATLMMERVTDLIATALILTVGFIFLPQFDAFSAYFWSILGVIVVSLLLIRLISRSADGADATRPLLPDRFAGRLSWIARFVGWLSRMPFISSFSEAMRDLERERMRLALATAMSLIYWALVGVTAWALSEAIDLSISPATATMVMLMTIFFVTAVPGAPSGIGTFEFAVVHMLGIFGVEHEAGFGFAIIAHAAFFLPPTLMAAVFLPREGIGSLRALRAVLSGRRPDRV